MKKIILGILLITGSLTGYSQQATAINQVAEIAAIKSSTVISSVSGDSIKLNTQSAENYIRVNNIKTDTSNSRLLSGRNYLQGINGKDFSTSVKQDSLNARTLAIKNYVFYSGDGFGVGYKAEQIRQGTAYLPGIDASAAFIPGMSVKLDTNNARTLVIDNYLSGVLITGGTTVKLLNTITTSTPTYASGDNVGSINTITGALRKSGGSGVLQDIIIWDKDNQKSNFVIDYWDTSPSGTYTDNAAEVIAGDHAAWLGSITISSGDYITQGAIARATYTGIGLGIKGNASANIFFTISTTSAGAYTTTSALIIRHTFLQD